MFPNRFHPGSKRMSRFSLTNVAAYLLNLVDARIIDDINVIQMARYVYTVEHCDSGSQAAIRIHEGRACNFVFMRLHSLIRSRFRNRINSWFSGIFFQSPQMWVEPPVIFPPFGIGNLPSYPLQNGNSCLAASPLGLAGICALKSTPTTFPASVVARP